MGIDINREMERLIGGHERGGNVSFQDFVKFLNIYHEGDVRHHFSEETVEAKATLNLFQHYDDERPASPPRDSLPRYIKGTGDVITWNNHYLEADRPKSPTKRFEQSPEFSIAEAPALPVTSISNQGQLDAHGRPFTPKRHYSHANSSRMSEILQWEHSAPQQQQQENGTTATNLNGIHNNEQQQQQQQQPDGQPSPSPQSPPPVNSKWLFRKSITDQNILTWENVPEQPAPPTRVRTPDRTHATLPDGAIHPKAPFGTDRDVYYNINPHRPNGR